MTYKYRVKVNCPDDLGKIVSSPRSGDVTGASDIWYIPATGVKISSILKKYADTPDGPVNIEPLFDEDYMGFNIGTEFDMDWGDNGGEEYHYDEVTIAGTANVIDLKIIGNKSLNSVCFIYGGTTIVSLNDSSISDDSSNKHVISNCVLFDHTYELDSNDIIGNMFCPVFLQGSETIQWQDMSKIASGESQPFSFLKRNEEFQNKWTMTFLSESESNHPASVLLYVDCYLAAFQIGLGRIFYDTSSDEKYCPSSELLVLTMAKNGELGTMRLHPQRTGLMACTDTYSEEDSENDLPFKLYTSKNVFNEGEQAHLHRGTILREHRWVEFTKPFQVATQKLARPRNIVVCIGKSDSDLTVDENKKISEICGVESRYARFTRFWLVSTDFSNGEYLMSSNDKFPVDVGKMCNSLYMPIFKPWAECLFVAYANKDNAFNGKTRRLLSRKIHSNYSDVRRVTWTAMLNTYSEKERLQVLKDYVRTVSPFRNEMYCTHGSRFEYDKTNSNDEGDGGIWFGKGMGVITETFQEIHDSIRNFSCRGLTPKYGIYMECCFSGGIQEGRQYIQMGNGQIVDAGKLLPDDANVWWYVDACATHPSYGSQSDSLSLYALEKINKEDDSENYKDLVQSFNALNSIRHDQLFEVIRKFYVDNQELMKGLLKSEYVEQWEYEKPFILDDLTNHKGTKYFPQYDWKPTCKDGSPNPNYNRSANFFDPDDKKFRINNGFIGWIKNKLFDMDDNDHSIFLPNDQLDDKFNTQLKRIFSGDAYSNGIYPADRTYKLSPITLPIMGCTGLFNSSTAKFMKNPDENEDRWLTSDKDLIQYNDKTHSYMNIAFMVNIEL